MNSFENSKLHHDLLMAQKALPFPVPENLDDLAAQKESFLQELQNQMANKSPSKRSSPQTASPVLNAQIPPSPLIPFLPYLQTPYVPMQHDSPSAPWNLSQNLMKNEIGSEKSKSGMSHCDTPLNLTKKIKMSDEQLPSRISHNNDGNNNTNKNQIHDHQASSSKASHSRLPYNLPGDDPDFFAACRLWPVMAAAAAHNTTSSNQNLGMMGATGSQRDAMMMNEGNFMGMNDVSPKQKRDAGNIGLTGDEKVRMVRQQGRNRNSADRDLIGKT